MIRFFKHSSLRLLKMGSAKACTLGPNAGDLVEEQFILYRP